MTLEFINPDDLPVPEMYTQVVIATGSRMVFVSGQQPEDIHGKPGRAILRCRRAWHLKKLSLQIVGVADDAHHPPGISMPLGSMPAPFICCRILISVD